MYPHQYLKFAAVLPPVALAFVMTASGLDAAQTDGAHFKESIIVNNTALRLTGTGLLRYWGFKVYVGAFYLEEGCPIDEALSDRAKRIEIQYEGRYYANYQANLFSLNYNDSIRMPDHETDQNRGLCRPQSIYGRLVRHCKHTDLYRNRRLQRH